MLKAPRNRIKMTSENFYAPVPVSAGAALDLTSPAVRLLAAFLAGRKAETIKAYRADLEDFRVFVQAPTLTEAAELLLARGQGEANAMALAYRSHLMERNLAAITINRRLTALRSMIKLGRTLGLVPWTLEIQGMKTEGYRDTRGPGRNGFRALLEVLNGRADAKTLRDRAILRCLFDLGLRRNEVVTLDLADRIRRPQMHPMLCGEIIEGQQLHAILGQALRQQSRDSWRQTDWAGHRTDNRQKAGPSRPAKFSPTSHAAFLLAVAVRISRASSISHLLRTFLSRHILNNSLTGKERVLLTLIW
jgi:integrase